MTTKQEKIEIFKKKVQDNSVNSKHWFNFLILLIETYST